MTKASLDKETFIALLDVLIPARNESLPGAGSLGIGDALEAELGEAIALVAEGLAALDEKAQASGFSSFVDLPAERRTTPVNEVAVAIPGFVEVLTYHAYGFYYGDPRVVVALGLKAEPPYPGGYELEPGNLAKLDTVRQSGKLYREV
ncbi:MAG: gluconate 2-dehydrogenase subunit 3 family protein [Myxococcota bacterium]